LVHRIVNTYFQLESSTRLFDNILNGVPEK